MVSCQNRSGSVKHAVVIRGKNTKIALRELNRWDSNDVDRLHQQNPILYCITRKFTHATYYR